MTTRLSRFCRKVIESAWLSSLIVVPLLINSHSNSVFELDKVAILRSLAVLILVAALVWKIENRVAGPSADSPGKTKRLREEFVGIVRHYRWALLGLLWLATLGLSTFASIVPRLSIWGSSARFQGLYTSAAYVVLFLAVLAFVRHREQLERIFNAVLLSSLPIALYGIIQRFGSDPILWNKETSERVTSSMGNPSFLGAFLIMVVPVTIYRHLEAGHRSSRDLTDRLQSIFIVGGTLNILFQVVAWSRGPITGSFGAVVTLGLWIIVGKTVEKPLLPFVRNGVYSVLLAAQLASIILTRSRGALLGLLTGLSIAALAWMVARGHRKRLLAMFALGLVLVSSLGLLNLSTSTLSLDSDLPFLHRFTRLLEGTGRVRLLVWEAADKLMREDPAALILGHGSEALHLVLASHLPPELGRLERSALPDRSHNATLDTLLTTGFAGLAVYLAIFLAILVRGLRWAGATPTPSQRRAVAACCLLGAGLCLIIFRLVDQSWRLAGLAVPTGMLLGIGGFLLARTARDYFTGHSVPLRLSHRRIPAVLIFSSLVAHFAETQVSFGITSTRLYFWVLLALFAGSSCLVRRPTKNESDTTPVAAMPPGTLSDNTLTANTLMLTLTLLTIVFNFVSRAQTEWWSVLWIFGVTGSLGGLMLVTERAQASALPLKNTGSMLAALWGFSIPVVVVFGLAHLLLQTRTDPTMVPVAYYLILLFFLPALALGLPTRRAMAPKTTGIGVFAFFILLGPALWVIQETNLEWVQADICFKQARLLAARPGGENESIRWARRALAIRPRQDEYFAFLGQIQSQKAERIRNTQQRDRLFEQAVNSLEEAQTLNPLLAEHLVNQGRLYAKWAALLKDDGAKLANFRRATSAYRRALMLQPGSVRWWNELAMTQAAMGKADEAQATFRHSLVLDRKFSGTHVELGRFHLTAGRLDQAVAAFQRAHDLNPESDDALRGLAVAYGQQGHLSQAARALQQLLLLQPQDLDSRLQLVRMSVLLGQGELARAHAAEVIRLTPAAERAAVEKILEEFLSRTRPSDAQ